MSGRITAKRVALVAQELTGPQTRIIEHLAVAKILTGQQLRSLTGSDSVYRRRALQRDLKHLSEVRVLARLGRRVGGVRAGSDGFVYALDVIGQRITDPAPRRQWRKPWTPGVRTLDHALAVSDLYVQVIEADRGQHLDLLWFSTEPRCWRSFTGPGGARLTLKPDAHVVLGVGEREHHAWCEIDRSTESLAWITEKAKVYARYHATGKEQAHEGVFPRCLWIAPDQSRAAGIAEALSRLPAGQWHLHHVTTSTDALQALTNEHQVIEGTTP